jgi:uncharacterized membrane protein (UPF0127 family)
MVRNVSRGTSLGEAVETADSSQTRNKGLLGRHGLEPGTGLWIVPCEAIHMFFMKFAIDVVYIDKKKTVRKTVKALRPWRISMCLAAHSVIELPVGAIDSSGTVVGDRLEIGKAE